MPACGSGCQVVLSSNSSSIVTAPLASANKRTLLETLSGENEK